MLGQCWTDAIQIVVIILLISKTGLRCRLDTMVEQYKWDASIQQLLQDGMLTGYALVSRHGSVQAAEGLLSSAMEASVHTVSGVSRNSTGPEQSASQMQQFARAFSGASAQASAFCLAGQRAVIFKQGDCDILAISRRRRLGLCVHALPFGILVCTYGRTKLPQEVVPKLLQICDTLRS